MPKTNNDSNEEPTNEISVTPFRLLLSPGQRPDALEMISGPDAPRLYELGSPEMVIGRANDAAIAVSSTDLSRRHVLVRKNPAGQIVIQDLDSRNGVYVNGVKIHSAVLHDGDNVQLGSVVFVFHEGRTA